MKRKKLKDLIAALGRLTEATAVVEAMRLLSEEELQAIREWAAEDDGCMGRWFFGGCADQVAMENREHRASNAEHRTSKGQGRTGKGERGMTKGVRS